ncbi:hypothetical protein [Ktedonobacter sp. SOSP1-52]|uniref:hypothetical protein n=1 Tax=Ktedonobacter sp. SOSP1-52 TaxID=2778366 RepID=UPI0019160D14|nr:hypothetical protein [Ktedonobacter sp. SOSP1-52]
MGQQEVSSSMANGQFKVETVQRLVQTLLSPLQVYCAYTTEQGSNLQTLQLCVYHVLVTMQALYQHHIPALAQLRMPAAVAQSGQVGETRESVEIFALRYQCWQRLREIEGQCVRLLPWAHMLNTILTMMLDQVERLPEPQQGQQTLARSQSEKATALSRRAGHDLVIPMKGWLDVYTRQPVFLSILGQSGLAPDTLQHLDRDLISFLQVAINMLEETFPKVVETLPARKHVQALVLLQLLQRNDFLIMQAVSLQRALSLLRHQNVPAGKTE